MTKQSSEPPRKEEPPSFSINPRLAESLRKQFFPNSPDPAQVARFFEVLGRAITTWQLVETALYEVYERAVAPMRPGACGASFHAIQTFNIKLSATSAAVQFALAEDESALDEWEKIQKKAQKKSQRRNEFVHFSTFIMYNETDPNEKIRLEPQIYDWRHIAARPKFRLSEITEIAERFVVLANELRRFRNKMPEVSQQNEAALGAPRPESP